MIADEARPTPPVASILGLQPNVPNPLQPSMMLRFELTEAGLVSVRIYMYRAAWSGASLPRGRAGREAALGGHGTAGTTTVARSLGVYYYRVEAGRSTRYGAYGVGPVAKLAP